MSSDAQAPLPGLAVAEHYIQKIRALVAAPATAALGALPLTHQTRPEYVEAVTWRLREFYQLTLIRPASADTVQAAWWDCVLDARGRRYFAREARLPVELAEKKAAELAQGTLLTLFDVYLRARDYMDQLAEGLRAARRELPR